MNIIIIIVIAMIIANNNVCMYWHQIRNGGTRLRSMRHGARDVYLWLRSRSTRIIIDGCAAQRRKETHTHKDADTHLLYIILSWSAHVHYLAKRDDSIFQWWPIFSLSFCALWRRFLILAVHIHLYYIFHTCYRNSFIVKISKLAWNSIYLSSFCSQGYIWK